jgi:hypothetical protein
MLSVTLLFGCSQENDPKQHLVQIYIVALEELVKEDEALNHDMKFIAIDMSNFQGVKKNEQEEIIHYFKNKYQVTVLDATLEELDGMGYFHSEKNSLAGILLQIEKLKIKFNRSVEFEGSKYRSSKGAVGIEGSVHYKDNRWIPKEVQMTRIS